MTDPLIIAAIAVVFLLAGGVKGMAVGYMYMPIYIVCPHHNVWCQVVCFTITTMFTEVFTCLHHWILSFHRV